MKKLNFFFGFLVLSVLLSACLKDEEGDREKLVELTIYAETGYGGSVLSEVWTEPLVFSDSDDTDKRLLVDIITEGIDFDYERGYEYVFKAKKVWMKEPPQDVSSVKYVLEELVSREKVITEDREEEMELLISAETVQFIPRYPVEYEEIDGGQVPKIYDALRARKVDSSHWMAIPEIEGFEFEPGYEYVVKVRKHTQAEPYAMHYQFLELVSKTEKS